MSLALTRRSLRPHKVVGFSTFSGNTTNGDPWVLYVPSGAGSNTPLVHFMHAYSEANTTINGTGLQSAIIAAGWAIVAADYSHGAPDEAWGAPVISGGNQRAVETCFMQADAAAKTASPVSLVTKLAVGGSMGLLNMLDALAYESGITTLAGIYGSCGVFNLADLYAGAHQPHINTAYNIPSGGTYTAQTSTGPSAPNRDPNLLTAAQIVNVSPIKRARYLFSAGDEVCHPDTNAAPFLTKLAGASGNLEASAIVDPTNADHLHPGGFTDYSASMGADFVAFGRRTLAGSDASAPAVPATPTNVTGALSATGNQIVWQDPLSPDANLKGWNVYIGGVLKGFVLRDLTGTWLQTRGISATDTSWTDTANHPFLLIHVGQPFYGDHVQPGTTIASFIDSGHITLSLPTTDSDNASGGRLRYVLPQPTYTFTGLTPSTAYTATIRAVNWDGVESADSGSASFTTSAAPAGPVLVQSAALKLGGSSTSWISNALTTPATANNLLVGYLVSKDGDGDQPLPGSGWTLATYGWVHFVGTVSVWYKIAAGGETTVNGTTPNAGIYECGLEEWSWSGKSWSIDRADPAVASDGDLGNNATSATPTQAGANAQAVELVVALIGTGGFMGGGKTGPTNGFTQGYDDSLGGNNVSILSSWLVTSSAAAKSTTQTWTQSQSAGYVIASFKGV